MTWTGRLFLLLLLLSLAGDAAAPEKDHDKEETEHVQAPPPPSAPDMTSVMAASAGVGLVGGTFAWFTRAWWRPKVAALVKWTPLLTLFSRFTARDAARHPTRARIVETLAARPGLPTADLAEAVGAHAGTLGHHLRVLEEHDRVKSVRAGRDRIWFLAGAGSDTAALSALAPPARRRLADVVRAEPGLHAAALAERVGLGRSTVHHHLSALESADLVRVERGLRARCFPTERLARLLTGATGAASFDEVARNG